MKDKWNDNDDLDDDDRQKENEDEDQVWVKGEKRKRIQLEGRKETALSALGAWDGAGSRKAVDQFPETEAFNTSKHVNSLKLEEFGTILPGSESQMFT